MMASSNVSSDAVTGIVQAAAKNDLKSVLALLKSVPSVNLSDAAGNTPLRVATQNGHEQMVVFLLDQGATVDAQHPITLNTALHEAIEARNIAMVRALLQRGRLTSARMI